MMNRAAYTEIWFINNFMLSPARDGSVTVFCCHILQVQILQGINLFSGKAAYLRDILDGFYTIRFLSLSCELVLIIYTSFLHLQVSVSH